MFRKVFKTVLILSLCLGVSLPTNAAVSVGDGSAFVSKAELAADLNNLSNRMAQLENALDARIDSLVSSYLSRNGIWNAAKQELTPNVDGQTYRFACEVTNGNRGTLFEKKVRFVDPMVAKTNKAGMAYGSFGYGNKHQGPANQWYYGGYTTAMSAGWIWDNNMCVTLSFYETDSNVTALTFDSAGNITNGELKSVVEIGKTLSYMNWGSKAIMAIPMPNWNMTPFVFFVDKDKKLWWRWLDEVSTYSCTNWYSKADFEGNFMKVSLVGVSIY